MKTIVNKLRQRCARNLHLVAVAAAGLGVAIFCSAYSVPEGCTPSVTVQPGGNSGCGSADVVATCVGDDTDDSVTVSDNGNEVASLFLNSDSGEWCDTTQWGQGKGLPMNISLVVGLNKITATSGEITDATSGDSGTSPEVDIKCSGLNSPTVVITATWDQYCCCLNIPFKYTCLKPNTTYVWHEDLTHTDWCPYCWGLGDPPTTYPSDGYGNITVPDHSYTVCPGYELTCTCTTVQDWGLDNFTDAIPNVLSGSTIREKVCVYDPENNIYTSTINFSSAGL